MRCWKFQRITLARVAKIAIIELMIRNTQFESNDVAYLSKIWLYPIKSLDGVPVQQAEILPSGALKGDREWAIVDQSGRFVNGKRFSQIHQIRATFDLELNTVTLQTPEKPHPQTFNLLSEQPDLEAYLSDYFQFKVYLKRDEITGFPDDLSANGPTVISEASLATVSNWFEGISSAEMGRRMRSNLEVAGVSAFWEDQLFAAEDQAFSFQIGNVQVLGINPCQRCIVPTRDSQTGQPTTEFQKIFSKLRQLTLPQETNISCFNHFYRLALNTKIPVSEAYKTIQIGDKIKLEDP